MTHKIAILFSIFLVGLFILYNVKDIRLQWIHFDGTEGLLDRTEQVLLNIMFFSSL